MEKRECSICCQRGDKKSDMIKQTKKSKKTFQDLRSSGKGAEVHREEEQGGENLQCVLRKVLAGKNDRMYNSQKGAKRMSWR